MRHFDFRRSSDATSPSGRSWRLRDSIAGLGAFRDPASERTYVPFRHELVNSNMKPRTDDFFLRSHLSLEFACVFVSSEAGEAGSF